MTIDEILKQLSEITARAVERQETTAEQNEQKGGGDNGRENQKV